ncbi:uncharacterized protein WCC33_018693 [Rhinophrynus dorsalis]
MIAVKGLLLAALCVQALSMPLSSRLSEEEKKVTQCIIEVLADSLSAPGSGRVSNWCLHILKEDERVESMLHHQHLMRELEDLAHRGKSQPSEDGEEDSIEEEEEEERRLRNKKALSPDPKRGAETKRNGETKRGAESEESRERQETKEIEKVEVKEKEHKVTGEARDRELLEEEEEEKKRNSLGKRGTEERKRTGKEARGAEGVKRQDKRHFSDEDEDSSEEDEGERRYHGNDHGWYHENHDGWEKRKRGTSRRMAEEPSEEETAQFESEDKGVKYYNSKTHLQGFHGEGKRHIHHPEEEEVGRERSFHHPEDGTVGRERHYHNGRPGNHEEQEAEEEEDRELEAIEEREEHKAEERELQKVEEELLKAAEKLQELHQG